MELSDKALKALKGSIKKWEDIIHNNGKDYATGNCDLCIAFLADEHDCQDEEGEHCPVAYEVGKTGCVGTPYEKWSAHHRLEHRSASVLEEYPHYLPLSIKCDKCRLIALEELEFLQSLLPKDNSNET